MSFFIDNWMLIAVAFVSGALLVWPAVAGGGGGAGTLDTTEAVRLMNREKAVVIDVGNPEEFAEGHIAGARNLPLDRLEAELGGAVKNKALPLIMVCGKGMRSKRAVAIAKQLGYENAQSLTGGMGAWRAANLPVEKA